MATKTGKLGIRLCFYAALAFGLALFSQLLAILVLTGFVCVVERDEWTARQCIEALLLTLVGYVISVLQVLVTGLAGLFGSYYAPGYNNLAGYVDYLTGGFYYEDGFWLLLAVGVGILEVLLSLYVFIWAIAGLLRVVKGREAAVPLVSKWAWAAYGKVAPAPTPPVPPPVPDDFYDGFKPDEDTTAPADAPEGPDGEAK